MIVACTLIAIHLAQTRKIPERNRGFHAEEFTFLGGAFTFSQSL